MQKMTVTLLTAIAVVLFGCGKNAPDGAFDDGDFVDVMDSIDITSETNTSLSIKTQWKAIKGKTVFWNGEVVDVKGGRGGRVELYVKKDEKPLHRNYNIIVTSYDEAKAGKLRKGDSVTFQGLIENKRQRSNGPLIIYIDNAQIIE